jgi:Ca2+-binding RTX toxin-like protein
VKASALTLGTSVAQAAVSYRAVDPNPANDTASATTQVTHDAVRRCPAANFVGGTSGNDRLTGSRFSDPIYAGTGNDVLFGLAGDDCLFGDRGDDRLFGGPGNDRLTGNAGRDVLHGGSGRDRMFGGASSDRLYGDAGNDTMDGGPGVDRLYGGSGNDKIMAADHRNEKVDCGPGPRDSVTADPGDRLLGCERVRIRR